MEEVKEDYEEVGEVDLDLEEDSALKIHFMDNEEEPSDNDTPFDDGRRKMIIRRILHKINQCNQFKQIS